MKNCITSVIKADAEELVGLSVESRILERRIEVLKQRILNAAVREIHTGGSHIKFKAERLFPFISRCRLESVLRQRKALPDDVLDNILQEVTEVRRTPRHMKIVFGKTHLKKIREALQAHGIEENTAQGVNASAVHVGTTEHRASTTN
jgi:hypothetical protein